MNKLIGAILIRYSRKYRSKVIKELEDGIDECVNGIVTLEKTIIDHTACIQFCKDFGYKDRVMILSLELTQMKTNKEIWENALKELDNGICIVLDIEEENS